MVYTGTPNYDKIVRHVGRGLILGAAIVATSIGEEFAVCSKGPSVSFRSFCVNKTLGDVTVWD